MDVRKLDPDYERKQEQENIASVATYNLLKRKSIYNELVMEFTKMSKMQMGPSEFIQIYSYKPVLYIVLAAAYHLRARSLRATWLFVHAGALLTINQFDLNAGAQKVNPDKYQEYKEASRNYELALGMTEVSVWDYLKRVITEKFTTATYARLLQLRPH